MTIEISRNDAQARGLRKFFTGKPCKNGHIAERYVQNGTCVQCLNRRIAPVIAAPNAAMPPSPYIFPSAARLTPELVVYVHARVLQTLPEFVKEFEAHLVDIGPIPPGMEPHHVANRVLAARGMREDAKALGVGNCEELTAKAARQPPVARGDDPPAGYRMTDKAGAATYGNFHAGGWKDSDLVAQGYMIQVTP
jgi:hypothetical protein